MKYSNSVLTNASKGICFVVGFCSFASTLQADDDFEHPPISYQDSSSKDPVARLFERIRSGDESLVPDSNGNYLKSLLHALNIPESSQCLVFSKTSMQILHIGPRTPRAIYFNDSTYVGMVVGSPILELAAIDPQLGTVFYTLERDEKSFQIIRDRGQCLSCHATSRTERVPGVLVRSIYSDRSGRPRSGSSTYITDHRSPLDQRWGGWYVTGQHGTMRHLGNIFADDRDDPQKVDMEAGANWDQLPKTIPISNYLQNTSDIVALMVLEHQTRVHNLITRANYESRQATYLDGSMNVALGRPSDFVSESTQRRIASVGEALVGGLLFADEVELSSPIEGSSDFDREFQTRGPVDAKGRSFYQFDLKRRMFRYPCSFLILSEHFEGLPESVGDYVRNRFRDILSGKSKPPPGVRLSKSEMETIRIMLTEFKPGWLAEKPLHEAKSP